jgi:hypothetical protein
MITAQQMTVGSKFKTESGIIWIIDSKVNDPRFGILVRTSIEDGKKGNYQTEINDAVAFLNEQKAELIPFTGGYKTLLAEDAVKQELIQADEVEDGKTVFICNTHKFWASLEPNGKYYTLALNDDIMADSLEECGKFLFKHLL